MVIIRTEKQKDNLSKFSYDMAKIILGIFVIGPIINKEVFQLHFFLWGIILGIILVLFGFMLDSRELIK